jgi:hypothetical protein
VKRFKTTMNMGKKTRIFFYLLLWLTIIPFLSFGQVSNQIITAFKAGDAKAVAFHFNENIELTILDHENVCSHAQGEQILKDFFSRNKPNDFLITHQGGKGSLYAIGKLSTSNGNFRVYFQIKPKANKPQIIQLRIDKD